MAEVLTALRNGTTLPTKEMEMDEGALALKREWEYMNACACSKCRDGVDSYDLPERKNFSPPFSLTVQ